MVQKLYHTFRTPVRCAESARNLFKVVPSSSVRRLSSAVRRLRSVVRRLSQRGSILTCLYNTCPIRFGVQFLTQGLIKLIPASLSR